MGEVGEPEGRGGADDQVVAVCSERAGHGLDDDLVFVPVLARARQRGNGVRVG